MWGMHLVPLKNYQISQFSNIYLIILRCIFNYIHWRLLAFLRVILKESWLHYKAKIITKYNLSLWEVDLFREKMNWRQQPSFWKEKCYHNDLFLSYGNIPLQHMYFKTLLKYPKTYKLMGSPLSGNSLSWNLHAGRSWTAALPPSLLRPSTACSPKKLNLLACAGNCSPFSCEKYSLLPITGGCSHPGPFCFHRLTGTATKNQCSCSQTCVSSTCNYID